MQDPQPVVTEPCLLGEGPIWVADAQALYWTDIKGRRLHAYFPDSGQHQSWEAPFRVGSIVPTRSGGFIGACDSGFFEVDSDFAHFRIIGEPEPDRPDNRFNDGKTDPHGRFLAGTMDDTETAACGALFRLDHNRTWARIDDGYRVTNGPAFSSDGRVMYHCDSARQIIYAYDVDGLGNASGRRVFARFAEADGYPDGMTVDRAGDLWVAFWDGWCLRRLSPSGEIAQTLAMPVQRPTSCAFGGPAADRLYITSSALGLDLADQPLAGSLFEFRPDVGGFASKPFGG